MSFMLAHGCCCGCGSLFSFNPNRVPSIRVNGVREPVCQSCIERSNRIRAAANPPLPLIEILPGAYDAEEVSC
jgi:hypothetical protein